MKRRTTEEFIAAARKVHGNKYDYSKANHINSQTRLTIVCPIHGEFLQFPHSHLRGSECNRCAMVSVGENKKFASKSQFEKRANKVHHDRYDYSHAVYVDYETDMKILCNKHGYFMQPPKYHLQGKGCVQCAEEQKALSNLEKFIKKAREVHNNYYSYEKFIYKNSKIKGIITCPIHGDFKQLIGNHLRGVGCSPCAVKARSEAAKDINRQLFEERANKVHNKFYDYSQTIYKSSDSKVNITCPVHGEFFQSPHSHLQGIGCSKCGRDSKTDTLAGFISKANEVHANLYSYKRFVYVMSQVKGAITCSIHGDFMQTPNRHLSGQGCPKCAFERISAANSLNSHGWTVETWEKSAKISKNFDSFKVYLLELSRDGEYFYKIGRTFTKSTERASRIPYKVSVIHEIISENSQSIFDLENELKRKYKSYKYLPTREFKGMQECFSLELPISDIIANYPTNYTPQIDDAPIPTP
jgi:hypothetical protein